MNPEPSGSIALLFLLPFTVILNLIIALILYIKKKKYVLYFIMNALISPFLMSYLFKQGISRSLDNTYQEWSFRIADTTFNITREKQDKYFSMTYSNTEGMSVGFLNGNYKSVKDGYLLTTDSNQYIIKNDFLFGFRKKGDSIKLTKTLF